MITRYVYCNQLSAAGKREKINAGRPRLLRTPFVIHFRGFYEPERPD